MSLKAILDTLDGLPDGMAEHYTEIADGTNAGKFRLDVTSVGGLTLEDTTGLKTSLQEARGERDRLKERLKGLGDLDATAVRAKLERLTELESIDPTKEADKLAEQKAKARIEQMAEHHRHEIEAKDRVIRKIVIQDAATQAIAKANGNPRALLPHVTSSLDMEMGDDGSVRVYVKDDKGNRRIRDGSGADMGIDDFVAELRSSEDFGFAFKASGHSGGGSTGSDGQSPTQKGDKPKRSEMNFREKGAFIREHGREAFERLPR